MSVRFIKFMIFFVGLSTAGLKLNAQVVTRWTVPSMFRSNSIIREWKTGYSIVYGISEWFPSSKCFFLYDPTGATHNLIELSDQYEVSDFRIVNDSVFFCGRDILTKVGIVGFFSIYNTVYGSFGISIGELKDNGSIPQYVRNAKRMDVFCYDGATHIVYVGDMVSSSMTYTTTVGEAYYNGGNWNIEFYDNTVGDMIFTDVAASNKCVAAVAKKNMDTNCYVHAFKAAPSFLNSPLSMGNVMVLNGRGPLGDILVEDLSDSQFALAYHYRTSSSSGTDLQMFQVDLTTATFVVQNALQVSHGPLELYSPTWKMKQLCYDQYTRHLILLHDVATQYLQIETNALFWYDMPNLSIGWINVSHAPEMVVDNIDAASDGGYWSIGEAENRLMFSRGRIGVGVNCRYEYQLSSILSAGVFSIAPYLNVIVPFQRGSSTIPITTDYPLQTVICEE